MVTKVAQFNFYRELFIALCAPLLNRKVVKGKTAIGQQRLLHTAKSRLSAAPCIGLLSGWATGSKEPSFMEKQKQVASVYTIQQLEKERKSFFLRKTFGLCWTYLFTSPTMYTVYTYRVYTRVSKSGTHGILILFKRKWLEGNLILEKTRSKKSLIPSSQQEFQDPIC